MEAVTSEGLTIMIAREFLNFPARYPDKTRLMIWMTELGISNKMVWSWENPKPEMIIVEKFDTTPFGICAAMAATNKRYVL